jgi:insertion element IS1 protein InsB
VVKKKYDELEPLKATLVPPKPYDEASRALELDELWSFVRKKANKRWIWIALSRWTRQVVAYAIGDRSEATCRKLWAQIPHGYRTGHCSTDFWEAYAKVLPKRRHTAVGKDTGETAHVERWNNTLRQRLGRFVRKSLSLSKSDLMHDVCLGLFLRRYNRECLATRG